MPIDASTLTSQEQITAIYVAYYDRAPDPAGLQFWVDQLEGGRPIEQIATDFSSAAETIEKYPYFDAPELASADSFITSIYANLFGRAPDPAGAQFWVDQLESGSTPVGEIILAILEGAQDEASGGFPDSETIINKIDVGIDWAIAAANAGIGTNSNLIAEDVDGELVVYDQSAFESATSILGGVTGDPQSVTDAQAATDEYFEGAANEGDTFTLTEGTDVLEGTQGNDTFIANNDTWNVGDNIDGASGIDTLIIANENEDLTLAGRTITGVENLTILNVDPNSGTQDFNIANQALDQVTVDYVGVEMERDLDLDNMRADTDLVITNAIVNNDDVYRNDSAVYSTLTGSVSQNNTFSNINTVQENDYVDFDNYAYFSNATELNLSLTLMDFITGDGSGEAGDYSDYIDLEADNAVVNVEYNVSNMVFENDDTAIDTYVDNGSLADGTTDTVNATYNLDNVDGLDVLLVTNNSGDSSDSDTVTVNVASGGLRDTDSSNEFQFNTVETLNFTIDGDADFGYIDAYSSVGAAQTVNIVANANMSVGDGTFDLADDQEVTVNISGAGDVSFDVNGDNYGLTVNAGTATGNLDLGVGSTSTYATVVTAGSGDDTITHLDAFETNADGDAFLEIFDGGDGIDTFESDTDDLVASLALLNADLPDFSDAIVNFERLSLTGVAGQAIDATDLGFDDVTIDGYTTLGSLDLASGGSVTVTGDGTTDYAINVDDAATGNTDSLNLNVNGEDGISLNDLTVADVETINLTSSATDPDETTPGANTVDLIADGTAALNISGETELVMGATTSLTDVETVDAAGFDAGLEIDLSSAAQAVTITTGAGADIVTGSAFNDTISVGDGGNMVTGGAGLDTINLGAGATADDVDTIVYAAVTDSQGVTVDVINGFQVNVQATTDTNSDDVVDEDDIINDLIDLSAILATGTSSYAGEANGYGAVLTTLQGGGTDSLAVLDISTNTLYWDVNADGQLDNNDMAIQLTGVTELSADNFVFV